MMVPLGLIMANPFWGVLLILNIAAWSSAGIISLSNTLITIGRLKSPLTTSSTAVKTVSVGAVINMVTVALSHSPLGLQMV